MRHAILTSRRKVWNLIAVAVVIFVVCFYILFYFTVILNNPHRIPVYITAERIEAFMMDPETEEGKVTNNVRILCWVMTSPENYQKVQSIKQTWENGCKKLLFIPSENEFASSKLSSSQLWSKTREVLQSIYLQKNKTSFDWFLKADDTTYVIFENLRYMLDVHDPNEPIYFDSRTNDSLRIASGGHFNIMSRKALQVFAEEGLSFSSGNTKCSVEQSSDGGDANSMLNKCMESLNISVRDTRDNLGRNLILSIDSGNQENFESGDVEQILRSQKLQNVSKMKEKIEDNSSEVALIAIQHLTPKEMMLLHFLINNLKVYDLEVKESSVFDTSETKGNENTRPQIIRTNSEREEPKLKIDVRNHPRKLCNCTQHSETIRALRKFKHNSRTVATTVISSMVDQVSSCSDEATAHGPNQKVLSYSLYMNPYLNFDRRNMTSEFFDGVATNMEDIRANYSSDWVARVYSDIPADYGNRTCDLICKYSDVLFWCDVHRIPGLGDLSQSVGRIWRFLPLGDPLVDIFVSRDLDSVVSTREWEIVAEWEAMKYAIHLMRDSPFHGSHLILAGMWGAKNSVLGFELSRQLQTSIVEASKTAGVNANKNRDQDILAQFIGEPFKNITLAHDSYFCTNPNYQVGHTLPFNTKRVRGFFVGGYRNNEENERPCPEICRPSYGKDWECC